MNSFVHQEFQVPKMEVLNLIRPFRGWVFPYINLTYSLYRWVPPFWVPEMSGDFVESSHKTVRHIYSHRYESVFFFVDPGFVNRRWNECSFRKNQPGGFFVVFEFWHIWHQNPWISFFSGLFSEGFITIKPPHPLEEKKHWNVSIRIEESQIQDE